jgi:microcystin-dependent protein
MPTTNFSFTVLAGSDAAGYDTINTCIESIDTNLNASTRLVPATGGTSGYTITWSGSAWAAGQLGTAGIADGAVTAGKIASSIAIPGTPTIATPPTYSSGATGNSTVASTKYVTDAVAYATAGNVTLAGDVSGNASANTIGSGVVTSSKIADNTIVIGDLAATLQALLVPTGSVVPYAGSTAPTGWVLCDGSTYNGNSGTDYNALYTVIGTTYGGTQSAFAVPDMRGRSVAGKDDMGGTAASRLTTTGGLSANNTLGATGGAQTVTLTSAQSGLPSHTHADTFAATASSHTHTYTGWDYQGSTLASGSAKAQYLPLSGSTSGSTTPTVTITGSVSSVTAANASSAHTNVQPTLVLNYIIKL